MRIGEMEKINTREAKKKNLYCRWQEMQNQEKVHTYFKMKYIMWLHVYEKWPSKSKKLILLERKGELELCVWLVQNRWDLVLASGNTVVRSFRVIDQKVECVSVDAKK